MANSLNKVTTKSILDATIATADIADDAVTEAKIADASVDEARLKISNSPTNGQFLSAQSGNTGGLTWATVDTSTLMPLAGGTFTGDVTFDGETAGRDIVWDRSDNRLEFADSAEITFGSSADSSIVHDGSHFTLTCATGNIRIRPKVGEEGLVLEPDGAAKLYYNNTERLASSATGVTIAGDLNLGDSNIIEVGASNDLQIWHDGSNSYIKNSTNALTIQGGVVAINDVANAKTSLSCDTDGAVSLYNDNTLVAGTRADGFEVRAASSQSAIIQIMANNAGSADDYWRIIADTGGDLQLWNYAGSSWTKRTNWTSSGRLSNPETYSAAGSSMRDVQVESNGNFCGQSSIRAAKKNITELTDVSWIYNLKPVSFNYRKRTDNADGTITWLEDIESEKAHGLIAEEVEAVNKDFVYYNKDKDDKDVLAGVYYKPLISPLIKAVKDLKAEVDTLKAKVAALESA